jgi:E3 ubiquitin-protein ligase RNF213
MPFQLQQRLSEIAIYSDNFYKMALIFLRISSKMPAIPMGETGIGKTALIELLSLMMGYQYLKLDVHAGVSKEEIIRIV